MYFNSLQLLFKLCVNVRVCVVQSFTSSRMNESEITEEKRSLIFKYAFSTNFL